MKSLSLLSVAGAGLGFALVACGSLDASTGTSPTLATLTGSLTNPQSVTVAGGAVRVAVVWRSTTSGQFNVAEDLPVQPVFPSSFTIQLDGPPPASAMNSSVPAEGSPPPPPEAGAGAPPEDASTPVTGSGPLPQYVPVNSEANLQYAIGSVVAYIDENGNGKLDLVPAGASGYVDKIVASNESMAVVYFQGPIPAGGTFGYQQLADGSGHLPTSGYNLINAPECDVQIEPPSSAACTATFDAGTCNPSEWLPMSAPYSLIVSSSPEVANLMCLSDESSGSVSSGSVPGGPFDPSKQPSQYPSPCDPNLDCAPDGSDYLYQTCVTVSQGICEGTVESCTSVGYARPTPVPAGWPCPGTN